MQNVFMREKPPRKALVGYSYADVFYDKFDSETDDHGFDTGPTFDDQYSRFNLP